MYRVSIVSFSLVDLQKALVPDPLKLVVYLVGNSQPMGKVPVKLTCRSGK